MRAKTLTKKIAKEGYHWQSKDGYNYGRVIWETNPPLNYYKEVADEENN